MATLTIRGNTFTPRSPSVSIVGQVNAEQVTFVVDESWRGLELQAQFSNTSTDREPIPVALDETMTCYVPAEATAQPGKVYVALAGYDDGVQIKLTDLLHYSNAKTGADPSGGVPPEEQTPGYLNQIKQILSETKEVAQSVRDDADQGKFNGKPGKNGEPGKSPKEEGGTWWLWNEEEQKWVDTGVLVAGKNGISPKVETQPVTGGTRVVITDADGEKSFDILNGKTPVKGIDYGTEQEIQEIAQQAAALVPCGGPDGYELIVTDVLKYDSALNFQFGKSYRNVVVTIKVPNGQTVTGDTRFVFDNRMTYFARGRGQYERIEFSFMGKIVRVIDIVGTLTIGSYAVDAYSALLTMSGFAAASNLITLQTFPAETEISVFGVIA